MGFSDLPFRDVTHPAHPDTEYRRAGHYHFTYHCFRSGDRLKNSGGWWRQLWGVHCAGPDHVESVNQQHFQWLFRIYFPICGYSLQILSAPVSTFEIVLGYKAASKALLLGFIILLTVSLFIELQIAHPLFMLAFLILTAIPFSLWFYSGNLGR